MLKRLSEVLFELLFKDIKWKLSALGLACLLWFVGMNVNNPVTTRTFNSRLTLSHQNILERDKVVILNEKQLTATAIEINVRGTRNDLDILSTRPSSIAASLDLRAIDTSLVLQSDEPVPIAVDVDVDILMPGFERVNRIPNSVDVMMDKYVRQIKSVQAYAVGEVAEGYELQEVTGANATVPVSGAKSLVDKVHTIRVQMDVQDADGDVERTGNLTAYDVNGNDITATVELGVKETQVYATVLPCKTVELTVSMTNTNMPADGYTVTDVSVSPKIVKIVGKQETLDSIRTLSLEGINLNNLSESITTVLDIRQALTNQDVVLKRGEPSEASVTVTIERQLTREFSYSPEVFRVVGYPMGASFRILNEEAAVISVRGAESVINGLTADRLNVQLDVYGLEPGEHTVALKVTLPRGVTLAGELPTLDVLIEAPVAANDAGTTSDGPVTDTPENGEAAETDGE